MIVAPRPAFALLARRFVHRSYALPAMIKLRNILQEHSEANFNQGLPSSFVARVLEHTDENDQGLVSAKAAQRTLSSIARDPQQSLSPEDAAEILKLELGVRDFEQDRLPMEHLMRLLFENVNKKGYGH